MTFKTQAEIPGDQALTSRIASCVARLNVDQDPYEWTRLRMWHFSAQPGWDEAYQSAQPDDNGQRGGDEAGVTDELIEAGVRAVAEREGVEITDPGIVDPEDSTDVDNPMDNHTEEADHEPEE